MSEFLVHNLGELQALATRWKSELQQSKVWLFYGEMAAGKTTFIRQLCKVLDVKDEPSSPTFSLVNEYTTTSGEKVYHFDFYRINSENEALDFGFEEYLDSGNYCFIEWPEKINNLLPKDCVRVKIELINETARKITLTR